MTNFLVKHLIKNYEDVDQISVRTAYGVMASVVGILCNWEFCVMCFYLA